MPMPRYVTPYDALDSGPMPYGAPYQQEDDPMAIGTTAAALIGAGGSLASGLLGSHSAGNAQKASEQANREALAYEKEKDRKAEAAEAQRQAQLQPLREMRYALLAKYGAKIPTAGGMNAMGTQPPPIMGGANAMPRPGMPPPVDPGMVPPEEQDPRMIQRRTLGNIPNWSEAAWMGER